MTADYGLRLWRTCFDRPKVATMKAPAFPLASMFALAVLTGCASNDEPGNTSPESSADSGLPNIALHEDSNTPITCDEWPDLSDDIQHGLVSYALVKSGKAPATDAKVSKAREIVHAECEAVPQSVVYEVATRAAMSEDG